jgi:hypothetical protein
MDEKDEDTRFQKRREAKDIKRLSLQQQKYKKIFQAY